jgi:hypothetical protein
MSKQTDLINIPDAITVDGTGILNLDSTFSSGTTGGIIRLKDAGTQFGDFNEDSGNFIISSAQVDKDIIFKGNDGGAIITAMTIDMSAGGNVGIGTSSPSTQLEVKGSTYSLIRVNGGNTNNAGIDFGDTDDVDIGRIRYDNSSDAMQFWTNNAERFRIDSSGNLLVGKTSTGLSVRGTQITSDGRLMVTRDGNQAADFNRKSSDGDIVKLQKDGTTVGSIGVGGGGVLTIGQGSNYIQFHDSINSFYASDGSSGRDNAMNIGAPLVRFKDLYLSGGIYLGGTGSANKLDDYEEGIHTSTASSSSGTPTIASGEDSLSYVKIGNVVHINGQLGTVSCSGCSGDLFVTMPFTNVSLNERADYAFMTVPKGDTGAGVSHFYIQNTGGGTSFQVVAVMANGTQDGSVATLMANEGNFDLNISGTYRTA